MTARLSVEVALARPERQDRVRLEVEPGTTLGEAVRRSGLLERHPELAREPLDAGIFSQPAPAETVLRDGDRVELYRPLATDPKDARRRRARTRR